MKLIIFIFAIFYNSIFSFTPGKWSVLDKFTIGNSKNGPSTEVVKNKSDQVLYTATYEYNSDGKLIKEKFTNSKSENDGEVNYTYENDLLVSEELVSPSGDSVEKKTFIYSQKKNLKEILITINSTKKTIRHKILSANKEFILDCETKWEDENSVENFTTKKDISSENVYLQDIYDEKKKQVGQIKYFFDKNNRLERRENSQSNTKRQQVMVYDENQNLVSIAFHVKQDEDWVLMKTHYLTYNNTNAKVEAKK